MSVTVGGRRLVPRGDATEVVIPYVAAATTQDLVLTLEASAGVAATPASGGGAASDAPAAVLSSWSFSVLHKGFSLCTEAYTLEAAYFVEREALLRNNAAASLLIRPRLLLHGSTVAPLAALIAPSLTVTSLDATGSTSQRVFRNLTLSADAEAVVTFAVPPGARSVTFQLAADVEVVATGGVVTLRAEAHHVEVSGDGGARAACDPGTDAPPRHLPPTPCHLS